MKVIGAGWTLYISGPEGPHLWVVVTDPAGDPETVVTVMLVTRRRHTDDTVILQPGDHPFIRHETSVSYSTADFRRVDRIVEQMHKGHCSARESLAPDVLARVQLGAATSPFTIHRIRDHCKHLFAA